MSLDWTTLLGYIIESSDPKKPMQRFMSWIEDEADKARNVYIVGMGKASGEMARALSGRIWADDSCIAVPRYLYERYIGLEYNICPSSHPVPGEDSLRAGYEIQRIADNAGEEDLVIALVSGGGSSLAEHLPDEISLDNLIQLNKLLLSSGASINEINTVRKHVSLLKGGRLAEKAYPAKIAAFLVSDVPGDRIDMIASGPTAPDPTTYSDALQVLDKYSLTSRVPRSILEYLEKGARGKVPETPKPGSPLFSRTRNLMLLTNIDVLKTVAERLRADHGLNTLILTSRIEGESREIGRALAAITIESLQRRIPVEPPAVILVGGETTVTVKGKGRGGRNMELALSWALSMRYWSTYTSWILSIDTDGIDGVTDAAGAWMEPRDIDRAIDIGLDPYHYLGENDSYTLLSRLGRLVKTGPTGTNVNSVTAVYLY